MNSNQPNDDESNVEGYDEKLPGMQLQDRIGRLRNYKKSNRMIRFNES